jgi:hypothetical protein
VLPEGLLVSARRVIPKYWGLHEEWGPGVIVGLEDRSFQLYFMR